MYKIHSCTCTHNKFFRVLLSFSISAQSLPDSLVRLQWAKLHVHKCINTIKQYIHCRQRSRHTESAQLWCYSSMPQPAVQHPHLQSCLTPNCYKHNNIGSTMCFSHKDVFFKHSRKKLTQYWQFSLLAGTKFQ